MAADQAQLLLSIDATTEILRSEVAKGTAALEKFATQSEHDANRVAEAFEKMGDKVKETGLEFAKLGAEILIGASIKSAIEQAIEYSEALNKTSQQLGVTTRFLQEFRFAAAQSATSAEAADKSLGKFSVTLGKAADGNKQAAEAFSKIGVNIADSAGNLRPSEAIFRDVADAITKIPDPARQAADAVAIFGKGGQSLLPILKAGSDGFDKFGEEAEKAGLILGEGTIDRLEEVSNAAKKVKQEISVELARAIGDNADALIRLGDAAGEAAKKFVYLLDQARGARYLTGQGRVLEALGSSGAQLAALGSPEGQLNDAEKRLASARGSSSAVISSPGQIDRLTAARNTAFASYLASSKLPAPAESDAGATGGKVTLPKDDSADRERERAQNELDRIAAQAEARLVGLRKEVDAVGAQITEEQAKLATTPEAKLSADIAAEEARTNALVAKQQLEAGDDTTKAQKSARATEIAGLKQLGAERIEVIRDNYAREHAATLANLEADNQEVLLQNRSANAALVKDDALRAELEKQIASDEVDFQIAQIDRQIEAEKKTLTDPEIAALRQKQAALAAGKSSKFEAIDLANQGPLQDFLDTLPDTTDKLNKAFQSVEADGLKSLTDGITDAITGAKSLGDAFSDVSKQIIADLVKIAVEKEIVGPLADALGFGDGKSGGGIFSALGSLFGGGHADGGEPPMGKISLVGERGPELFVPKVPGDIKSNGQFGMGGQRQAVDVHVTTETVPNALFGQIVGVAVSQGQAENNRLRDRTGRTLARGRG